ncbi:MAG: hypothetical protein NTV70_10195 [Acidobacteria bacterium]|nr:hypothetical protein [Acidobacteriota bacterium]
MSAAFVLLLALAPSPPPAPPRDPLLSRLAEEAEVFAQSVAKLIGEETIRQRALKSGTRFRPRIGQAALEPPKPVYQARELASEFGYTTIGDLWHEAREVRLVDGRTVQSTDKARRKLVLGLRSDDDLVKKKLLEDLEKHGLLGSATDFTLSLLMFRGRNLENYQFAPVRRERVGADEAMIYSFTQSGGDESFTIFQGKKTVRQKLTGHIWLRASDGLPLRIHLNTTTGGQDGVEVADDAVIDYVRNPVGLLLPASVLHRRMANNQLLAENNFTYSNFKRFSSDSEIKFTPAEEEEPPSAAPPANPNRRPNP